MIEFFMRFCKDSEKDADLDKGRRIRKSEMLIRRPPRGKGEINFLSS